MTIFGTVAITPRVPTAHGPRVDQLVLKGRQDSFGCHTKLLTNYLVEYDETDDYNLNMPFSGGIDPANLPEAKVNGKCQPLYPHQRVHVNTLFEVAVAAGKKTAYADKHPSYDIVSEFAFTSRRGVF
jgi:hypothetical protein